MRLNRPILAVLLGLQTGTVLAATVTIDGGQSYQVIDGFGVNANHRSWNANELKPVLDALVDQAGMTIFRVIMDKADWEATNDNADPNVINWDYYVGTPQQPKIYDSADFQKMWDMSAYLNQKGIVNGLMFNFQGQGPAWMAPQPLAAGMEAEWAEMVGSLLIYARNTQHIAFTLVAPDNEEDQWAQGIDMSSSQYVTALHRLAQFLDAHGLSDVRFVGPDLSTTSTAWLTAMMSDPTVMAKLAHFGLHNYDAAQTAGIYNFLAASAYPDRSFWVTEFNVWCDTCEAAPPNAHGINTWAYARGTAEYLIRNLADGASAGLIWEGYDSQYNYYGPGQWSYWGLFGVDNTGASPKTYTPRKQFYAVAPITKYIRPGAKRINVSGSSGLTYLLAFLHATLGQLTMVGENTAGAAVTLAGNLANLPAISSLDLYYTSSSTDLGHSVTVPVVNHAFSVSVPADCIFALTGFTSGTPIPPFPPSNLRVSGG